MEMHGAATEVQIILYANVTESQWILYIVLLPQAVVKRFSTSLMVQKLSKLISQTTKKSNCAHMRLDLMWAESLI